MSNGQEANGRTHEPALREVVAELDGLKELTLAKFLGLRELLDERDRLYKERDEARKTAVDAALQAAKEKNTDAFLASEKAIVKAEDAQKEYNARSNEFRGQLDDQNKLMLTRTEANTKFSTYDEKIEQVRQEIQGLRESRSGNVAIEQRETAATQRTQWSTGVIISTILGSIAAVLSFSAIVVLIVTRH